MKIYTHARLPVLVMVLALLLATALPGYAAQPTGPIAGTPSFLDWLGSFISFDFDSSIFTKERSGLDPNGTPLPETEPDGEGYGADPDGVPSPDDNSGG